MLDGSFLSFVFVCMWHVLIDDHDVFVRILVNIDDPFAFGFFLSNLFIYFFGTNDTTLGSKTIKNV